MKITTIHTEFLALRRFRIELKSGKDTTILIGYNGLVNLGLS
jgi:hypothetical protein